MTSPLLPQIGVDPPERGDAARNRRLLLDAAALLVAERGVDAVTMDAVACKAGVGKGTVFRRFGSRSGLMHALLDHTERELQQSFMFGPPPLGPGADPIDRLIAFGHARIAIVEVQGEVQRAAENSLEFRFAAPARAVSVRHVVSLLRAAGGCTATTNCSPAPCSHRSRPRWYCTNCATSGCPWNVSATRGRT